MVPAGCRQSPYLSAGAAQLRPAKTFSCAFPGFPLRVGSTVFRTSLLHSGVQDTSMVLTVCKIRADNFKKFHCSCDSLISFYSVFSEIPFSASMIVKPSILAHLQFLRTLRLWF